MQVHKEIKGRQHGNSNAAALLFDII